MSNNFYANMIEFLAKRYKDYYRSLSTSELNNLKAIYSHMGDDYVYAVDVVVSVLEERKVETAIEDLINDDNN